MKKIALGLSAATLAFATPLAAQIEPIKVDVTLPSKAGKQPDADDLAKAMTDDPEWQAMMEAFKPEPLTAEQEARLPLAREVMRLMMPDGAMAEMFDGIFSDLMNPLVEIGSEDQTNTAVELLGWWIEDDDIDSNEAAEIVAIIDPAREQREAIEMEAMQRGMSAAMTAMEPAMREAMSRAYAAEFDDTELTDVKAFFLTPSGASFAAKSYKLASDPSLFAGIMGELPQMMGPMMAAMQESEAQIAALPQQKTYVDLSDEERARLSALTGLDSEELEEAMEEYEEDVDDVDIEGDEPIDDDE